VSLDPRFVCEECQIHHPIEGAHALPTADQLGNDRDGYTLFQNAWYCEGAARWSEDLLSEVAGQAGSLPKKNWTAPTIWYHGRAA
jgi:hypothetical protein